MDGLSRVHDVATRFVELLDREGIPRFDHARLNLNDEELWFVWEERKRVVVVELGGRDPADVAADALGDPARWKPRA